MSTRRFHSVLPWMFQLIQIVQSKWIYFRNYINYIEWTIIITTLLLCLDFDNPCQRATGIRLVSARTKIPWPQLHLCGETCAGIVSSGKTKGKLAKQRQNSLKKAFSSFQAWQWQISGIAIFWAWLNLVLFMRKLPVVGIYSVMFTDVLMTFIRFFPVLFLLATAFGLSFHSLLGNQVSFFDT